jgi:hypothetical protein
MIMLESSMKELEHCRAVLLRVIEGLSSQQLDFLMFPDSKSVGEMLLHVAGFEFLMVSGAGLLCGDSPDHHLWHKLKPGFSREAGFSPPKGRSLDDYIAALAEVRERAVCNFNPDGERRLVAKAKFPVAALTAVLCGTDPEADAKLYEKLAVGVSTSFSDDGAENERGEVDLVNLLRLHETYHREQITFQKYIYSRLRGTNS